MFTLAASGIVLMWPKAAILLLAAEVVPAAAILHEYAFLSICVLAAWHIYDAIFNPDTFPLDIGIVTGMISMRRMQEEHPGELEEKK